MPFFCGSHGGARTDLEAVAFGALGIGALHGRIGVARAGDRTLGVVDDDPRRHAAEPCEGAAMAVQPRRHGLVEHHLGVLVARPAQRHHEDPGLERLAGARVRHERPGPEIDLHRIAGCEVQPHRGRRRQRGRMRLHEPAHRRIAAAVTMVAAQRGVDGRALRAGLQPTLDLRPERLQGGNARRHARRTCEHRRQRFVIGQRRDRIEPALLDRHLAHRARLRTTHQAGAGNLAIRIALPHPQQGLSVLIHLQTPLAHRRLLAKAEESSEWVGVRDPVSGWQEEHWTKAFRKPYWLHYADHQVAPLRRSWSGSITPIFDWLHYRDHGMALLGRSLTPESDSARPQSTHQRAQLMHIPTQRGAQLQAVRPFQFNRS